ncbi:MAG: type secretion protein [Rhodospirillales bacterium]|nr:type secretion protein [Rhodospirillales bacterium]
MLRSPAPYPNIALGSTAIPSQVTTQIMAMQVHNMATVMPLSNGDNAGLLTGVASGMVMGPSRHLLGSFTTIIGGMPMTRLTSITLQNSTNMVGCRLVPSQVTMLVLEP